MKSYRVIEKREGWWLIWSGGFGAQLWVKTKRVLVAPKRCAECDQILQGVLAYRPLTNGSNRGDRLCVGCVEGRRPVS